MQNIRIKHLIFIQSWAMLLSFNRWCVALTSTLPEAYNTADDAKTIMQSAVHLCPLEEWRLAKGSLEHKILRKHSIFFFS